MVKLPTKLLRSPVRAISIVAIDIQEKAIANKLPEDYTLAGGVLRFPAGYWETYFVDGKEYNYDGTRSLEEQKKLIAKDLLEEGFDEKDIDHFIDQIPVKEGYPMLLEMEASLRWLRQHPEYEQKAFDALSEARRAVKGELGSELKKFK